MPAQRNYPLPDLMAHCLIFETRLCLLACQHLPFVQQPHEGTAPAQQPAAQHSEGCDLVANQSGG
eukprot:286764-Pelagomonas_calceolata.AAC.1